VSSNEETPPGAQSGGVSSVPTPTSRKETDVSLPSVQDVCHALICVAGTNDVDQDSMRTLARMLLPYTDPDQAHLAVLDIREAILQGRATVDVTAAKVWWAKADMIASNAAVWDRESVPA